MNMIRKVIKNGVEHELTSIFTKLKRDTFVATFILDRGVAFTESGNDIKYELDISHLRNNHYTMIGLVFMDSKGEFTQIPVEGVPCVVGGDASGTNYKYKNVDFFHTDKGTEPVIVLINRERLCVILTKEILKRFDTDAIVSITFKSVPYPFKKKKNTILGMSWFGLLGRNK